MQDSKTSSTPHVAPVTTREELVFLLSRASELEHGLACIYLFAVSSMQTVRPASKTGSDPSKR